MHTKEIYCARHELASHAHKLNLVMENSDDVTALHILAARRVSIDRDGSRGSVESLFLNPIVCSFTVWRPVKTLNRLRGCANWSGSPPSTGSSRPHFPCRETHTCSNNANSLYTRVDTRHVHVCLWLICNRHQPMDFRHPAQ